jgi:hypothetical protein
MELQQAGHTAQQSTELARTLAILNMHARAVQLESEKRKAQADGEAAQAAAAGPSSGTRLHAGLFAPDTD